MDIINPTAFVVPNSQLSALCGRTRVGYSFWLPMLSKRDALAQVLSRPHKYSERLKATWEADEEQNQ